MTTDENTSTPDPSAVPESGARTLLLTSTPIIRVAGTYITRGVQAWITEQQDQDGAIAEVVQIVGRLLRGDWGAVPVEDALANKDSLLDGSRVLGAYEGGWEGKLWVIADAEDQNGARVVTVLFPSEY